MARSFVFLANSYKLEVVLGVLVRIMKPCREVSRKSALTH